MVYLSVTILYPSIQFEELYESFINLGVYLPQKIILFMDMLLLPGWEV